MIIWSFCAAGVFAVVLLSNLLLVLLLSTAPLLYLSGRLDRRTTLQHITPSHILPVHSKLCIWPSKQLKQSQHRMVLSFSHRQLYTKSHHSPAIFFLWDFFSLGNVQAVVVVVFSFFFCKSQLELNVPFPLLTVPKLPRKQRRTEQIIEKSPASGIICVMWYIQVVFNLKMM